MTADAGFCRSTLRTASGFRGRRRCGFNAIWPARSSAIMSPRQTMSRSAPFGWTQFRAWQSLSVANC
jgi:hypothetical protein